VKTSVMDGGGKIQLFEVWGQLTIDNLLLVNGYTELSGGAIYAYSNSTLIIISSKFTDNRAEDNGGAIATEVTSSLFILDATLSSNSATNGGALHILGNLRCYNSIVSSNRAEVQGGAILGGLSSDIQVYNSTCSDNVCAGSGGCFSSTGILECTNVKIVGNEAMFGSAQVHTDLGSSLIMNNSFYSNQYGKRRFGHSVASGPLLDELVFDVIFGLGQLGCGNSK
jgi:predicted outer membrane repeat protein